MDNKKLVIPFIAISLVMILIVTGGLSYAYFTWWGTVGAVKATATDTYPARVERNCSVSINNSSDLTQPCDLNFAISYAGMGQSSNNSTTPKFSKFCSVVVKVNGLPGDSATFSVGIKAGTPNANMITGYTWSAGELTYQGGSIGATNLFAVNTTGSLIADNTTITVGASGSVTSTVGVAINFFNLNKNQTPLTSLNYSLCANMNAAAAGCHDNTTSSKLIYYLYTPTFSCSLP